MTYLMETIYIHNGDNSFDAPITDSCERSHSLQQHNYVKLVWKSAENTPISANAYIEYEGQVFYCLDDYFPTHKEGIYEYDIEFHSIEDTFNRPLFFRHVDILDQTTGETTSWKEIEWSLNGNLRTIAEIVVDSLNRAYDNAYFVLPNDSYVDTLLQSYSFDSNSIADALSTIAEQNETEWWLETTDEYVDGKRKYILHFDKCELGDTIELNDNYTEDANGIWQSGGLKSVSQSGNTNIIPQKLYVYGSERNIIKKTVEQEVAGGVMNVSYDKKLRLPKRLANNTTIYPLESVGKLLYLNEDSSITISGINNKFEQVKIFDEVYPKMNMTVKGVSVQNPNSENPIYWLKGDRLKSITTENPADDSINPGKLGLLIEGCTLMCTFTSGLLNGREFECSWRESSAEIGLIPIDENDVQIPSGVFKPQEGDTFILWNLAMPQSSIDIAQKELLTEAINYIEELVTSITETDCTTEAEATRISGLNTKIKVGQRISVNSNVFRNGRLSSRIINFSYNLTKPYDISFTLASSRQTGRLATLQNLIADVTHEVHSVGQVQRAISRRQWHDTEEMMSMLDSIQKQMVVVGDENNSFTTTCNVAYNDTNKELFISKGYLQHQSYTDNEWKGAWLIEQDKTISMPALDEKGVTPFYVYFVCSKENNTGYAEIGSALPQYNDNYVFVLGILSSEFEGERIFNQSSGLTSIAGGTITTDVVQDPGRRLIIDYSNATIIARNGATIKGAIEFEKGEGENDLGSALEGLLNGVNNLQQQVDGEKTAWFLEGMPTPNNKPASDWTTEELRQRHEGDTYTNINSSTIDHLGNVNVWEQGGTNAQIGQTYEECKYAHNLRLRTKNILPNNSNAKLSVNSNWTMFVLYFDDNMLYNGANSGWQSTVTLDNTYPYIAILLNRGGTQITPSDITFPIVIDGKFDYDPTAGQSWRWCNVDDEYGTGWHWHKIADSDAVKALSEAGKAQLTAEEAEKRAKESIEMVTELSEQVDKDIAEAVQTAEDAKTAANTANTTISDAFANESMNPTEQKAIKNTLGELERTYSALDKEYLDVINSTYLNDTSVVINGTSYATPKTTLSKAKGTLTSTYNAYHNEISKLANASFYDTNGKYLFALKYSNIGTSADAINTALSQYNSAVTAYKQALSVAQENIRVNLAKAGEDYANGVVDNLQIGGVNLASYNSISRYDNVQKTGNYGFKQITSDTKTNFELKIDNYNWVSNYDTWSPNIIISKLGIYSYSIKTSYETSIIRVGANGSARDTLVSFKLAETIPSGTQITVSVEITNITQGSFAFKNVQVELGNKATAWKPNDADIINATENIIKDSFFFKFTNGNTHGTNYRLLDLSQALKPNTEYVLSTFKSSQSSSNSTYPVQSKFTLKIYNFNGGGNRVILNIPIGDTLQVVKFTTPSTVTSDDKIFFYAGYVQNEDGTTNSSDKNMTDRYKTLTMYGLMLAEGNVYSPWKAATPEEEESLHLLQDAINGSTEIEGGLVLTNLIELKNQSGEVTAGINGLDTTQGGVNSALRFWAGAPLGSSSSAPFRVYDDGRVFGTHFYGYLSATIIDSSNYTQYMTPLNDIDLTLTGQIIYLDRSLIDVSSFQISFPKEQRYIGSEVTIINPHKIPLRTCGNVLPPTYATAATAFTSDSNKARPSMPTTGNYYTLGIRKLSNNTTSEIATTYYPYFTYHSYGVCNKTDITRDCAVLKFRFIETYPFRIVTSDAAASDVPHLLQVKEYKSYTGYTHHTYAFWCLEEEYFPRTY